MGWFHRFFRTVAGTGKLDNEIDKELRFHIDELTTENIAAGMSPEQARREAMIVLGGMTQVAEECRRTRSIQWFGDFLQDLRFGLRTLRKSPGYTFAIIVALSLGIGANTALFTLFNGIALQPLGVPESNRVVELFKTTPAFPRPLPTFSYVDYLYLHDNNTVFDEICASVSGRLRMSGASGGLPEAPSTILGISGAKQLPGSTESVSSIFVSSSYFSVMRINPVAGSAFHPADDGKIGPPFPAMLSENFWERRFGRDPSILGKNLTFSGVPAVIVGITPRDFMGTRNRVPDVWLPLAAWDVSHVTFEVEARLKDGVNLKQAEVALAQIAGAFQRDTDPEDKWRISLDLAKPDFGRNKGLPAIYGLLLQPAFAMVLLIACANVAGLLLGKNAARQKEIAVRLSMGASRGRLIRQLLTEGVLIAQFAGMLSLLMTSWLLKVAVQVAVSAFQSSASSEGGTYLIKVAPDLKVLLYALGVSLLTGIVFALLPALQATKPNLTAALNEEIAGFGVKRTSSFHGWLVATQIAVSLMLLIGAGTLVRSSTRLLTTDPGFVDWTHVLTIAISNPTQLGYSPARSAALSRQLQSRLAVLPGIKSFTTASRIPLGGNVARTSVTPVGGPISGPQAESLMPRYPFTFVSAEYFETVGVPLLKGRVITQADISTGLAVAVVSEGLAKQLWPGQDAIGKTIRVGSPTQSAFQIQRLPFFSSMEIVGVVRDVYSDSMVAPDPGALYIPNQPSGWEGNLFVRTSDPRTLAATLSTELQSMDRNLSATFQTMDSVMKSDNAFIVVRTFGIIFSVIGLLGLALASVGIYSMVGYTVSQQTREVGIRMALGAQRADVLRLVIGRSIPPIGVGIIGGVILGVILSLGMSSQSPGLKFLGPGALAGISLLLTVIALTAAYVPTRKAMNLDPAVALRAQ